MPLSKHIDALEAVYARYARREFVHPDPLELLYRFEAPCDCEIVGLIASSLAYGRVSQILNSASGVLERMGSSPARFLRDASHGDLEKIFSGFKHRFQTARELVALLLGIKNAIGKHGSLQACFRSHLDGADELVLPALCGFVRALDAGGRCGHLLPDPSKGSACKRLNLYLRWMVRRDDVDPGCWDGIAPAMLIVPLDTHMHRIALGLGATRRKSADLRAAIETTEAFRKICPSDPVRYDFALTRLGIHPDGDIETFLTECSEARR